jgi:predicted transcriptional regulator of viral defense system
MALLCQIFSGYMRRFLLINQNLHHPFLNWGVATRIKPGLFILVPYKLGKEKEYMGKPLVVARELMSGKDYYLSHGTSMNIHGMVTQPQFAEGKFLRKWRLQLNVTPDELLAVVRT